MLALNGQPRTVAVRDTPLACAVPDTGKAGPIDLGCVPVPVAVATGAPSPASP